MSPYPGHGRAEVGDETHLGRLDFFWLSASHRRQCGHFNTSHWECVSGSGIARVLSSAEGAKAACCECDPPLVQAIGSDTEDLEERDRDLAKSEHFGEKHILAWSGSKQSAFDGIC